MSASIIKLGCGDNDASALARHCFSQPFYLGSVLCKDHKNGFRAAVLHIQSFSDQKGRLRNPACSNAASVADLKVDEFPSDDCHVGHPELIAIQTLRQLPSSASVGAA